MKKLFAVWALLVIVVARGDCRPGRQAASRQPQGFPHREGIQPGRGNRSVRDHHQQRGLPVPQQRYFQSLSKSFTSVAVASSIKPYRVARPAAS